MKKYLFSGLVGLILLVLAACGGDDKAAAPAAVATTAPAAPAATSAPAAKAQSSSITLKDIAAKLAGGPGSIYVGDLSQLVGLAPGDGSMGAEGNMVPIEMLQEFSWLFKTDYYTSLLEKAKLTNPTELTTSGEDIDIQYACINRALLPCALQIAYWAPNVFERTNGQVDITISSFPELGLSGADMISLIDDGTISFAHIQPAYVGGTMPLIDIIYMWGIWEDPKSEHLSNTSMLTELDAAMEANTGGGKLIYHVWYGGNDQFFFSTRPLRTPEDFAGLKTRSHGTTMTDAINGLGGEGQFMAFAEVYTAMERGILNAGVTGGHAGYGQRWYEVTDYLVGPFISMPMGFETMNGDVWDSIPSNLQDIIMEEGAIMELENLRLAAVWNTTAISVNEDAGMEYIPYDDAMKEFIFNDVVLGRILPNWIKRVGPTEIALFNKAVAPYAGVTIESDLSLTVSATGQTIVSADAALQAYADAHAGGPGAIYVGDLSQLVGPAKTEGQGGFDGGVPMASIEKNKWLFESDYYQEILKKAKLLNPTELTTSGEDITIQHACINRSLLPCQMVTETYGPGIFERTNGQLTIQITSFPELGVSGTDTISLVSDGVLGMANVYSGYVAGELPAIEIQSLWGMFSTQKDQYDATVAIHPNLEKLVSDAADGAVIVNHNWFAGIDQFFFCHDKLETLADFKGKKTRSHSAAISDWIEGMGASAQFVAFAEVYTALERGILDCGVTGADPAYGQRWYEVTKYMNGPLISFFSTNNVVNSDVWAKLPKDFQQIMLEEGAKAELEAHRVAAIQIDVGTEKNTRAGLEMVIFSEALQEHSYNVAVLDHVIPGWLRRLGGTDHPYVALFNEKIQPIVGLRIESDGSVTKTGVTKR